MRHVSREGLLTQAGRLLTAGMLLSLAFGACASSRPVAQTPEARLEAEIRQRGLDPSRVVLPFRPDDEMRSWVRDRIMSAGEPERRLEQLLDAILHRENGLKYQRNVTATAPEVWRLGRANCLSFTHLYVGLAREVGLPVYYLRVYDLQRYEKDGDLIVASEHVTAAWGPPTARRIVDFTEQPVGGYHDTEPLSDLSAVSLYYSNLGAERIREGRLDEAAELLEIAVKLDSEMADAWLNRGVVLRRLGRTSAAESSFRMALEANPRMVPAYENLATLLRKEGRESEAAALMQLAQVIGTRNPFSYLALGDVAFREQRFKEAERFYKRALRMDAHQAETLAALGLCAYVMGRPHEAERWLRKAEKVNPAESRTLTLARQLRGPRSHAEDPEG